MQLILFVTEISVFWGVLIDRINVQAKHCYYKYNEFFRCEKFRGAGAEQCKEIKAAFISLCPNDWVRQCVAACVPSCVDSDCNHSNLLVVSQVNKWDEQRANNTFPGPL